MRTEDISAAGLATIISAHRFRWASETDLQEGLAQCLAEYGYPVEREVRLSGRDRIDLLVHRTGIEVKVAKPGTATPIERVLAQLGRYAQSDQVDELVLVSTSARHRIVPQTVGGKPLRAVVLQSGLR